MKSTGGGYRLPGESNDQDWWFCLKHMKPEHGPGCPDKDRMGPYATEADAAGALRRAKERNETYDEDEQRFRDG